VLSYEHLTNSYLYTLYCQIAIVNRTFVLSNVNIYVLLFMLSSLRCCSLHSMLSDVYSFLFTPCAIHCTPCCQMSIDIHYTSCYPVFSLTAQSTRNNAEDWITRSVMNIYRHLTTQSTSNNTEDWITRSVMNIYRHLTTQSTSNNTEDWIT
jgi:hypothetical protein